MCGRTITTRTITITKLHICTTGFLFIVPATMTISLIIPLPLTEEVLIIKSREGSIHNNPTEIRDNRNSFLFEFDFEAPRVDVRICVQYFPFKIHYLYLNIIHFIKHISFSIDCLYNLHFTIISSIMVFLFKLEFVIRVITAPLWSSWLGYSALTREARVQFPVGE